MRYDTPSTSLASGSNIGAPINERSTALRADLDRLVLEGIVPDRVRHLVSEQQAGAESQLKADWELVKEKWK